MATYVGVRIQGGLLPAEVLSRLAAGDGDLGGLGSGDYGLATNESVREAANRSWAYLTGVWAAYRGALAELPGTDWATTLTRERWLSILLNELGYGRVPLTGAGGIQVGEKAFPVSHQWEHVPIHLLGARVPLDKRTPGLAGAATSSPQSMVQELLNRSEGRLWGILSNGTHLRLLRDSTALVGSAYVEFDLEAIFDGDLFSDFVLLYTLCHQSRVEIRDPGEEATPHDCWLEQWRQTAVDSGSRALEQLRGGVVAALNELGTGFLAHPANSGLREWVADRTLSLEDLNHALLRLIYRLLFTFVAEDRGVLLSPNAPAEARDRYLKYFSTERLRRVARRRRGGRHGDLWPALTLVWKGLGTSEGRPELGIEPIGGLFEPGELDVLDACELSNQTLLTAVRSLSLMTEPKSGIKRIVDYRNLGAEELGSIYEALLEYIPRWDPSTRTYSLVSAASNARKTTGSYYTPSSLVDFLLDSALSPALQRAANAPDPEQAYLSLTVCDPACGSGHFLVAAARRIAKRVAALRSGDPEPPPEAVREAMCDVVSRCIYGVDVNPLAAELAKVSLWLETMEPGKPLAFLDAQIKVGNSLIGATPALVEAGIPDDAFRPVSGDEKTVAASIRRRNSMEGAAETLFTIDGERETNQIFAAGMSEIVRERPQSLADVHVRRQRLRMLKESPEYRRQRAAADAWCAAFVWVKTKSAPPAVINDTLLRIKSGERIASATAEEIERLATEYRFFHWYLEFPQLFPTTSTDSSDQHGWLGGFDVVLGNPPWEQAELDSVDFFARYDANLASLTSAHQREAAISRLLARVPGLEVEFQRARRHPAALTHFARTSGRYPRTARGRINLYHLFGETFDCLGAEDGSVGVILPTGVVTDFNSAGLCASWIDDKRLVQVADFVNKRLIFEGVKPPVRFSLITLAKRPKSVATIHSLCLGVTVEELHLKNRWVSIPADLPRRMNPETGVLPLLKDSRDVAMATRVYAAQPLFRALGLGTRQGFINMTTDSGAFLTKEDIEGQAAKSGEDTRGRARLSPVYESKLFSAYNAISHTFEGVPATRRFATKASPVEVDLANSLLAAGYLPEPRYWVPSELVNREWPSERDWVIAGKEVTDNKTSARTGVFALLPRSALSYTCQVVIADRHSAREALFLLACLNSLACDYLIRQKISGSHLTASILRQVPVVSPTSAVRPAPWDEGQSLLDWVAYRSHNLCVVTTELESVSEESGFATSIAASRSPVLRAHVNADLDACFLHLFGFRRDEAEFILDSFEILGRLERGRHGEYRTKRIVMEAYDSMQRAVDTRVPYGR